MVFEEQEKKIKTIRPRTIEVKLSDADVKRISQMAGSHGLTVGELIQSFIGDLVCGTYSNGSDERMYAEKWFNRCRFGVIYDYTFLSYLLDCDGLEEVIDALNAIEDSKQSIKQTEEECASGVKESAWKDIFHYDGTPCYHSVEEWEASEREDIEQAREEIANRRTTIDDYWKEYIKQNKEYENGTLDEEMKIVLDYWQKYQQFLGGDEAEKQDENV